MSDRTGGATVDACLGDGAHVLLRHAARRLDQRPATGRLHYRSHLLDRHVVQQHDIGVAGERLARLSHARHLDLDRHALGRVSSCPFDDLGDGEAAGACRRQMVVLDQHAVAQVEAVVLPAAYSHGVALQRSQARRRLARVQDANVEAGYGIDQPAGGAGDAREPLEEVEGDPFAAQDRRERAGDGGQAIARRYYGALRQSRLEAERWVERGEDGGGHGQPADHTRALCDDRRLALLAGRDQRPCRHIALGGVLLQRRVYQAAHEAGIEWGDLRLRHRF